MNESVLLWQMAKMIMSHFDGAMTNDDSTRKVILENLIFEHLFFIVGQYIYFQTNEIVKWQECMI